MHKFIISILNNRLLCRQQNLLLHFSSSFFYLFSCLYYQIVDPLAMYFSSQIHLFCAVSVVLQSDIRSISTPGSVSIWEPARSMFTHSNNKNTKENNLDHRHECTSVGKKLKHQQFLDCTSCVYSGVGPHTTTFVFSYTKPYFRLLMGQTYCKLLVSA